MLPFTYIHKHLLTYIHVHACIHTYIHKEKWSVGSSSNYPVVEHRAVEDIHPIAQHELGVARAGHSQTFRELKRLIEAIGVMAGTTYKQYIHTYMHALLAYFAHL